MDPAPGPFPKSAAAPAVPLPHGGDGLSVDQASAAMAALMQAVTAIEAVPLAQALGRVLAADVVSPIAVPAHDNAAMDGYALASHCLQPTGSTALRVAGTALAGAPYTPAVAAGHCVRIMTGAMMPAGLDTVVPHEQCRAEDGHIHIAPGTLGAGAHRRLRGEDLAPGQTALQAGRRLRPADLGLLASLGLTDISVRRRLRVAVFSTGSELCAPGQPLAPGCVYDSNRYSLLGALQRLGMHGIDLGLVADEPAALHAALAAAAAQADVVLTSGGVSAGDADHTRAVLAGLGDVAFWQVAMRPGRPFALGRLRRTDGRAPAWLLALPGNPVAALVAFYALAHDALLRLAGATVLPRPLLRLPCTDAIAKRPGRTEFQRGIVEAAPAGGWQVRLTGPQGAGVLSSMAAANALVVLGHDQGPVAAGEPVAVWLFDGLA